MFKLTKYRYCPVKVNQSQDPGPGRKLGTEPGAGGPGPGGRDRASVTERYLSKFKQMPGAGAGRQGSGGPGPGLCGFGAVNLNTASKPCNAIFIYYYQARVHWGGAGGGATPPPLAWSSVGTSKLFWVSRQIDVPFLSLFFFTFGLSLTKKFLMNNRRTKIEVGV